MCAAGYFGGSAAAFCLRALAAQKLQVRGRGQEIGNALRVIGTPVRKAVSVIAQCLENVR